MASRPALQLFPPPQRPRHTSPNRSPNSRLRVKPPSPEPAAQRMDSAKSAKAPGDFHELVIQVNSVPVSPSNSITAPPKAHIPKLQVSTNPSSNVGPSFPPPPPRRTPSPRFNRTPSPSPPAHENANRPGSPSFNGAPPARSNSSHMGKKRAASPAFSDMRSGSPTLVRANSSATTRSPVIISPSSPVPMRSMFPVYDPHVPLGQQQYRPTETSPTHVQVKVSRSPYSPDYYIPYGNITSAQGSSAPAKPFFTPSHLLDNLWVACNGQEAPAVQLYTLRMHRATPVNKMITFGTVPSLPFYSMSQANLGGNSGIESIMHELLIQRHHPSQPRALPVAHLDLITPPSMTDANAYMQESTTLLTNIYPKLAALAALDVAANSPAASHIAFSDPGATSPAAQRLAQDVLLGQAQRESCALSWTRESTTQQNNPWSHAMPSQGSYQLHHPTLGIFPIQMEGDCSGINRPSSRPQTAVYGHNMAQTQQQIPRQKPASITLLNPFILSPSSPRAFAPPPPPRMDSVMSGRPDSLAPSEVDITQLATTTDAVADDAMLAKLDFTNDALILNLGAIAHFGNPFFADVAASTLLAVAVAESVRNKDKRGSDSAVSFEAPPPSTALGPKEKSTARSFQDGFVEGWESFGPKTKKPSALRNWSLRSSSTRTDSFDKDIELGDWYGQKSKMSSKEKKAARKARDEEEDGLPFVARGILGLVKFGIRVIIFVLGIGFKIIAGLIVMISKNFSKL